MKPTRKVSRRSFVTSVVGGIAAGGSATALLIGRAEAQNTRYTGVTDSDTGNGADRPGFGTGVRNRYTDQDTGPNADPQFGGRGPSGSSPSGTQYNNNTQSNTRCSDSDYGQNGDPGGYGRGCRGLPPNQYAPSVSGCTDSDTGNNADSVRNGRHCTPQ